MTPRTPRTARARLIVVLVLFAPAMWLSSLEVTGLPSIMLIGSALFLVVQLTWLRGVLRPRGMFLWSFTVPALLGVALVLPFGADGIFFYPTIGVAAAVIAVPAGFAGLWLGDLSQLRRRPSVFISYRRDDAARAGRLLYESLVARYGRHTVFFDTQSLTPGVSWRQQLREVIERCDIVLVVIGPGWTELRGATGSRRLDDQDDPVRAEIEAALALGKPTVPILVDGAVLPRPERLPESIRLLPDLHGVALRPPPDFVADLAALGDSLDNTQRPRARGSILALTRPTGRWRRTRIALAAAVYAAVVTVPTAWGVFTSDAADFDAAVLSPDGRRVATLGGGSLRVWNIETGALEGRRSLSEDSYDMLLWSPDGTMISVAGQREGSLTIWRADDLTALHDLAGHQGFGWTSIGGRDPVAWSPDSTRIAAGDESGTLRVWRIETAQRTDTTRPTDPLQPAADLSLEGGGITTLGWGPGAPDRIAVGTQDASVRIVRVEDELTVTDAFLQAPPEPRDAARPPGLATGLPTQASSTTSVAYLAWSPDGRRIMTMTDQRTWVNDLDATGDRTREVPVKDYAEDLSWSPDGTGFARAERGTSDGLGVYDIDSGTRVVLPTGLWEYSGRHDLAWSADSAEVAMVDRFHIRIWSRDQRHQVAVVSHDDADEGVAMIGWAAGTHRIAVYTRDAVQVWDVDTGSMAAEFRVPVGEALFG
ncbi:WD40 repeat protein [Allocatelliglobosispora scoriae]|uniref:WD40 repeat protein n=1 Tax=Allocatelliglobosispora scoriae TaxID=643052 RepID=A0A841BC16_9ACTN|nr:toll/interleukin-1 receptor domain-containing protein [Allocatelliglobosispora scoriae]MBB5866647.1 WD40 repeat protein [Allocatelliglobosispora scoriae]